MSNLNTLLQVISSSTPRVQLAGDALFDFSISPTDAEVGYRLLSTGNEQSFEGISAPYVTIIAWLLSGSASDYDCRLTVNTGTTPAGSATGVWLSLGTSRAWTLTDASPFGGVIVNNCTITIRDATTLIVLASATVAMTVKESA